MQQHDNKDDYNRSLQRAINGKDMHFITPIQVGGNNYPLGYLLATPINANGDNDGDGDGDANTVDIATQTKHPSLLPNGSLRQKNVEEMKTRNLQQSESNRRRNRNSD